MPPYPDRALLKTEIIARVASGETVAAICAERGMPTPACVQVWRRGDAWFAGELAAARTRGAWRRERMFREDVAAAFLARVAAGAAITSLLGRPGMPSQRAYRYWRRTQVAFQATLWRLRGARYGRQAGAAHARWRGFDAAVAERIRRAVMTGAVLRRLLALDGALPCLAVVERWRAEQPDWDRALRAAMAQGRLARGRGVVRRGGGRCTPATADAVLDRVMAGATLRGLAREPGMPCQRTLYSWMRKRPGFAAEVRKAQMIRDLTQRRGAAGTAKGRAALTAALKAEAGCDGPG